MWPDPARIPAVMILPIELIGSIVIAYYILVAVAQIARGRPTRTVRLTVAQGIVSGLGFKVAASLLKTIELRSWNQIGLFATVLVLRTVVKGLLTWESADLRRRAESGALQPGQ